MIGFYQGIPPYFIISESVYVEYVAFYVRKNYI